MKRRFLVIFPAVLLIATVVVLTPLRRERNENSSETLPGQTGQTATAADMATIAAPRSPEKSGPPKNEPHAARAWATNFLTHLPQPVKGAPITFELAKDQPAAGVIQHVERKNGEVVYVSGQLTQPEPGRFFFQKQTGPGRSGDFVGVVEFPGSGTAYRVEPTGPNGAPELVKRPLAQVICLRLPPPGAGAESEEIPPLYPDDFPSNVPIPEYQNGIVVLQSLVGATGVVYLDFQPGYTPTWGGISYASQNFSNTKIRDIWQRVSEDFMPFNINVTTDLKVFRNAPETSRIRVVFTPTTTAAPGSGGVAYYDSWNWSGDTPVWVFNSGTKSAAEAASHEVGHSVNLHHDGKTDGTTYFSGHGSGATGWAPIMGTGYSDDVVQFSKGEYTDANQTENDLNIIVAQNSIDYRTDDTGNTLAAARYLEIYPGNIAGAQGVVERTADTDAFQFTTTGGTMSLTASPLPGDWANLAISATLCDANNNVIASNNPQNVLSASISTNLAAGTYTIRVTGVGRNDPASDGFSDYASMGYYSITGTVVNARPPNRFTIAENSTNGMAVGVVPATNPGGNPLVYTIVSGNTGNTFTLNNTGNLAVANNALLNYETLAANVQLAVQFEMFVNITNTVNPAQTELNRRVLVAITNVNEPPAITGFTTNVLEHTLVGTVIGALPGTDPDYFTLLTYSIVGGNTNGRFAIGNQSGLLTVAGDLVAATQSLYDLKIAVTDSSLTVTSTVLVTVVTNNSPFAPGGMNYNVYTGLPDPTIASLTNSPDFPASPDVEKIVTLAEGDTDWADDYGATLRGYLIPPTSGNYRFYLATDNAGQLFMSTNSAATASTNPANMRLIASILTDNYATSRQWNKYASQRSVQIALTAGQAYYFEARMKETYGGDSIAVGWTGPGLSGTNVIPGLYLAPFDMFQAGPLVWTGGSALTNAWKDANNWSPASSPRTANSLRFTATGATNGLGLVDNVISANVTVSNLNYTAFTNNFHTTRIPTNVTLTLSALTGNLLFVGTDADDGADPVVHATMTGGGRLVVGDFAAPSGDAVVHVGQRSATSGNHRGILDLSGLNSFTAGVGYFFVGGNGGSSPLIRDQGTLYLARTNLLRAVSTDSAGAFRLAHSPGNQGSGSEMRLGQDNSIYTDHLRIGGARGGGSGGVVKFNNPGYAILRLRAADATSRMDELGIGDNSDGPGTTASNGTLDLTGGVADLLVTTLHVGRNATGSGTGQGNGSLIVETGLIDATTINLGAQSGANSTALVTGTMNVNGTAAINAGDINIGRDAGNASGFGTGVLNLNSGTVNVSGDFIENNAASGNGSSTLNIGTNGVLNLTGGGAVQVDTINLDRGRLFNASISPAANNTNVTISGSGVLSNVTHSGQNDFIPGGTNSAGSLTNRGNFALNATSKLFFNITNSPVVGGGVNDYIFVGGNLSPNAAAIVVSPLSPLAFGSYRLLDYTGSLTGAFSFTNQGRYSLSQTTPKQINLFVTNGALVWRGAVSSNWDVGLTANWNNSTEYFQQGDYVTFNNTGTRTNVNLTTTVTPASVTFSTSGNYAFSGPGKISGSTGLTKNSLGTLFVHTTNDFTGPVSVNTGNLRVYGALGNAPVNVGSGAAISGVGVIGGAVTMQSGSTFDPGASGFGTLRVKSNLVFLAGSTALMEINRLSGAGDFATGISNLTYGGTLNLSLLGPGTLTNGMVIPLFSAASYSGAFASITPPTPGAGLLWHTNMLTTDGTLRVVPAVSLVPTNLVFALTGDQLEISWPADHTGWRLVGQTNTVDTGISNNWFTVPGSAVTNRVILPMNPANGAVFYRLVYP